MAANVMAFRLIDEGTDLGTVATRVKKQDWYLAGVKAMSGKPSPADAATFCAAARSNVASLDLNSVDQGIVAQAVIASMGLKKLAVLQNEPKCLCKYKKCAM